MQRLKTFWQQLTTRLPTRRAAAPTDDLATLTQQHGDLLKLRWWYWRHYFLEAKRQQLDAQRDQ
jgi:hypothetical protein